MSGGDTLFISFAIPIRMELLGSEPAYINEISASFKYKKHACVVMFQGKGDTNEIPGDHKLFSRGIEDLFFLISDTQDGYLAGLVQGNKWVEVEERLRRIVNHFIKILRNHGRVVFLHELDAPAYEYVAETRLRQWKVKTGEGTEQMTELLSPGFSGLFGGLLSNSFPTQQFPTLNTHNWLGVLEALKATDSAFLPEENEFTVNAMENLRLKNYRLAVMEMIIALEITLDKFLRIYLEDIKHVPPKRIDKFLSPQLGLTAKISALLNVTFEEWEIDDIDIDRVLKTITWRNDIVHKTGNRLPVDTPKIIEDALEQVRNLIFNIRFKIDKTRDDLEFGKMGVKLSEKHKVPMPMMIRRFTYAVAVRFIYIESLEPLPVEQKMTEIIVDITKLLQGYDCRLGDYLNLKVGFIGYPSCKCIEWKKGVFAESTYSKIDIEPVNPMEGNFKFKLHK